LFSGDFGVWQVQRNSNQSINMSVSQSVSQILASAGLHRAGSVWQYKNKLTKCDEKLKQTGTKKDVEQDSRDGGNNNRSLRCAV